jgi:uncharacterized protein with HEPN domain
MKRDYSFFIKDILSAVKSIEKFVGDMSLEELRQDDKTSSAVIRKFEIIGEASKQIPDWLREKHPKIPWKRMTGMRDRLIHAYFGIDYKLVWDAVKIEIPSLRQKLKGILAELERENKDS